MMMKLAVLFLVLMVAMALALARPKKKPKAKRKRGVKRPGVTEAKKCPRCGAFVIDGAPCTCDD